MAAEVSCDVVVPAKALSRDLMAAVFETFVTHVLYMRGQIPVPHAQLLLQQQEQEGGGFKQRSAARKKAKFVNELGAQLMAIRAHFLYSVVRPDEACLLLGTSAVTPREMFSLRFSDEQALQSDDDEDEVNVKGAEGGEDNGWDRNRKLNGLRRRMLRALVSQWQGGEGKVRLLNVFLAVRVPASAAACTDAFDGADARSKVLRRVEGYRPRLRRRAPPHLACRLSAAPAPDDQEEGSRIDGDSDGSNSDEQEYDHKETGVRDGGSNAVSWFVSQRGVHALRTPDNKPGKDDC